ncbi:helix-turn-helix domain-containing protein [Paraburkholderia terrae]|uniref:helix-turn-helix domain-containing protein n=1 Tax=Paraburkholderia terrae TaxID=311230 RepID=UPI0030842281
MPSVTHTDILTRRMDAGQHPVPPIILQQRGLSSSVFHLRMTREELGSYPGLTTKTVSRMFSRLQKIGLISVHTAGR